MPLLQYLIRFAWRRMIISPVSHFHKQCNNFYSIYVTYTVVRNKPATHWDVV